MLWDLLVAMEQPFGPSVGSAGPAAKSVAPVSRLVALVAPSVDIRTGAERSGRRASAPCTLVLLRAAARQLNVKLDRARKEGSPTYPHQKADPLQG